MQSRLPAKIIQLEFTLLCSLLLIENFVVAFELTSASID